MEFSAYAFVYEAFYTLRLVTGMFLMSSLFLKNQMKIKPVFTYLIGLVYLLIGASYYLLFWYLSSHGILGYDGMRVISISWYTLVIALGYGVLELSYQGRFEEKLFILACSTLMECGIFGLERTFIDMGVLQLRGYNLRYILVSLAVTLFVYIPMFFFFRHYAKKNQISVITKKRFFIVYLFASIALYLFLRFNLQALYEESQNIQKKWVLNVSLIVYSLFILVMNLMFVDDYNSVAEKEMISLIMAEREKQFNFSMENVETINRKCHDLKRQLKAFELVSEEERKQAIDEMRKSVSFYDSQTKTSNPIINAIFSEKGMYCVNHNIRLTTIADVSSLDSISEVDLYVLCSNLLDNAIEAVEKLKEGKEKTISCTIKNSVGLIIMEIKNPYEGEIHLVKGLPQTSKDDKIIHGYGVRSIEAIIRKYDGSLSIDTEDGVYVL